MNIYILSNFYYKFKGFFGVYIPVLKHEVLTPKIDKFHEETEKIGATDENATTRATYVVFHILDVNGQNHTLWYSYKYEDKQSDGTWEETGSGSKSIWEVIRFFIAHLGGGN